MQKMPIHENENPFNLESFYYFLPLSFLHTFGGCSGLVHLEDFLFSFGILSLVGTDSEFSNSILSFKERLCTSRRSVTALCALKSFLY